MWITNERKKEQKAVLAGGGYIESGRKKEGGRLSNMMAMLLGVIVTIEIMIAGAMIFNFDLRAADGIALLFAFVVLYFGVVAVLTDK